jgi:hypothetical protein
MSTNTLKDILQWYYKVRLRKVIQNYLGNVLTSKKLKHL